MHRAVLLAVALLLPLLALGVSGTKLVGHTRVLAEVKDTVPFPEGIVVKEGRVYVSGPAIFPTSGLPASRIGVYDASTGALLKTLEVSGQDLGKEHALSGLALDAAGRLYVIDTQQGVLRFNTETGAQELYAPPLPGIVAGTFPLANDLAFDDKGFLYVSDSFQGALWRIPPGGGAPQLWFRAPVLATGPLQFGPNGVRMHPTRRELWFAHTQSGNLYALPLVDEPSPSQLRVVHRFSDGSGPDGLAFSRSGKLYVTLAFSNQVAILTPQPEAAKAAGTKAASLKEERFKEERIGGDGVWDAPANIAFSSGGMMLVTNHAIVSRRAEHFMVLEVVVKDSASPQTLANVP